MLNNNNPGPAMLINRDNSSISPASRTENMEAGAHSGFRLNI